MFVYYSTLKRLLMFAKPSGMSARSDHYTFPAVNEDRLNPMTV